MSILLVHLMNTVCMQCSQASTQESHLVVLDSILDVDEPYDLQLFCNLRGPVPDHIETLLCNCLWRDAASRVACTRTSNAERRMACSGCCKGHVLAAWQLTSTPERLKNLPRTLGTVSNH